MIRPELKAHLKPPASRSRLVVPWSHGELERIFASARAMPGEIAGIPAGKWWFALLAVMLDTGLPVSELLALTQDDYNHAKGRLCGKQLMFKLHPQAVEALDAIRRHPHLALFPWPLDNGRAPFHMLHRAYKELLFRADLSHVQTNMFQRLQSTGKVSPNVLGKLNFSMVFTLRSDRPKFTRATSPTKPTGKRKGRPRTRPTVTEDPPTPSIPEALHIAIDSPRTLRRFFDENYHPHRLADGQKDSGLDYHTTINWLRKYCACEPMLDCLSDELLEQFMAWLKRAGKANATINRKRAHLLALWRHAVRKRQLNELPRDVIKYRLPKRIPEAWTVEEIGIILRAAATTPGHVCGIPAGKWWAALILTLYDTGLRIAAVMQIRMNDLDMGGWLHVPADRQKQQADQVFRLHPQTMKLLLTMLSVREFLFPWPYDKNGKAHYLALHYREILKRAGLPHGRRDLFHKLRRTSATAIADAFDLPTAQKHLGHSGPDMTRRYVDPTKLRRNHTGAEDIQRPDWRDDDAERN